MAPLFSIITITYNASPTIGVTMKSVAAQTCKLYEHIVVDGASTDATVELAQRFATDRTAIISEPDRGLYDAMNKGLGMATGDYVIFLNAGDAFAADTTLELIADTIVDNDYPGIVYGRTRLVDSSRKFVGMRHLEAPEVLTVESFADGMVVCHQAFIVLRKLVDNYDLRYRYSADYEWCLRCLQRSKRNVYIPEIIIDYLNEGVTTRNHFASLRERFRIMCHYYGVIPTVWRHVGFFFRNLKRKWQKN